MNAADRLQDLLSEEQTALRHGDAEAVFALAQEKEELVDQLRQDPPSSERLEALLTDNRRNGLLARSGLSLLNQVLGTVPSYGPEPPKTAAGQFLNESA